MTKKIYYKVFISITLILIPAILFPDEKNTEDNNLRATDPGWYIDSSAGARYNYDGLGLKINIYYKFPLVNDPGILWRSTCIDIGVQEFISPAFQRLSAFLKIMPIAFFDITSYAGYDYMYKKGNGGMKELDSPDAEYDSDSLEKIDGKAAGGFRTSIIPCLKFRYNNIAAMYSLKIEYHDYHKNKYYYDHETNLIHKSEDTIFGHDATLAYILGPFNDAGTFIIAANLTDYYVKSSGNNSMLFLLALQYIFGKSILPEKMEADFTIAGGTFLQDRYKEGEPSFAINIGIRKKIL